MSLATRLSAFFLIALALVLSGFSGSLYLLARTYLVRQLDERLEQALDTLEASVDIEPGGLEWEPADRRMTLGVDTAVSAVRWAVRDGQNSLVDRSLNSHSVSFPTGWTPPAWPGDPADETVFGAAPGWRVAGRRLRLDALLKQGRGHPNDEPGYEVPYRVLVLVVALSPEPVEAALGRLGLTLVVLTIVIWSTAAAIGRRLCLRALAPVSRMAKAATAMTAADLGRPLPAPGTNDELDELGHAFNDLLERLDQAFDRMSEACEQQRRFAGDASHQLRTPLTALLGQVQVALRHDRSPGEYRRVLELVHTEGIRLRQIVEALLFMAQPDGSRPVPQSVDLAEWLPNHLRRWADHPRAADLRFDTSAVSPLCVRIHGPLLSQLVDNLLENACKYSAPGTPVVARLGRDGGFALLGVEDRGRGLAPEDASHVFEPFFRSDQARQDGQPGVGLGLAVASRIAATLGGAIDLKSEPGVGSTFTLRLPESPSTPPPPDAIKTPPPVEEIATHA